MIDIRGIYALRNIINNHIYIGSSKNINRRFEIHLWELKRGKHHCSHLQHSFNKYGNVLELDIIQYCREDDNLLKEEQKWIDFFKPEYNSTKFAVSGKALGKKIYQYTLEGEFVKEWNSQLQCGLALGLDCKYMSFVVNSKRIRKLQNWIFTNYKKDKVQPWTRTGKLINCFNKQGKLVGTFKTGYEAANFCGTDQAKVTKILNNVYGVKSAKGFTFKYNQ